MNGVDDLVAFLTAQWDELEQAAISALRGGDEDFPFPRWRRAARWQSDYQRVTAVWSDGNHDDGPIAIAQNANWSAARHIALHDPAAVLADVAAKRAIISEYGGAKFT